MIVLCTTIAVLRKPYLEINWLTCSNGAKNVENNFGYQTWVKFNNLEDTLKSTYSESCFANYVYIGSDMNVYPCVMERRLCHGNLRNHSLSEILDKKLINFSKKDVKVCCQCEFRHICKDCRPDSLSMKVDDKPWYCSYNVETGEWTDINTFIDEILDNKENS